MTEERLAEIKNTIYPPEASLPRSLDGLMAAELFFALEKERAKVARVRVLHVMTNGVCEECFVNFSEEDTPECPTISALVEEHD
jgi:hypothetical protein